MSLGLSPGEGGGCSSARSADFSICEILQDSIRKQDPFCINIHTSWRPHLCSKTPSSHRLWGGARAQPHSQMRNIFISSGNERESCQRIMNSASKLGNKSLGSARCHRKHDSCYQLGLFLLTPIQRGFLTVSQEQGGSRHHGSTPGTGVPEYLGAFPLPALSPSELVTRDHPSPDNTQARKPRNGSTSSQDSLGGGGVGRKGRKFPRSPQKN